MHGLIAYSGPDTDTARRAIETLTSSTNTAVSHDNRTIVATLGSGTTTKLIASSNSAAAFFGSAAQGCTSNPTALLDADPDDVVAAGFGADGELVAAAG
ncbi:MAG: hypothetical protein ACKOA5_00190, partial [Actinomycetota bacterium]